MKIGIVAVLVGVVVVAGAATAAASSSICRAPENCTAVTVDDHVDKAVIASDRDTRGAWSLKCERGGGLLDLARSQESTQRGFFIQGDRKVIEPELSNAECVLRARGHSPGIAKVRVALTS